MLGRNSEEGEGVSDISMLESIGAGAAHSSVLACGEGWCRPGLKRLLSCFTGMKSVCVREWSAELSVPLETSLSNTA